MEGGVIRYTPLAVLAAGMHGGIQKPGADRAIYGGIPHPQAEKGMHSPTQATVVSPNINQPEAGNRIPISQSVAAYRLPRERTVRPRRASPAPPAQPVPPASNPVRPRVRR